MCVISQQDFENEEIGYAPYKPVRMDEKDKINRDLDVNSVIKNKVQDAEGCDEAYRRELESILQENSEVFMRKTGTIKGFQYSFRVKEHNRFCVRPYIIPAHYRDRVREEINSMLKEGVIEKTKSTYNSPLHIVEKSNGEIRLVLDSRQINTIILPETDRPQTLQELLQNFHDIKVLTSIDLRSSFWQIELDPKCREYTAFLCFGVCYRFRKLPFGLNISSSAFIRGLNTVLPEKLKQKITSYVDDILIAGKSWEEHNNTLRELLQVFKEAGITVNLEKSHFGKTQVKFLSTLR